MWWINTCHRSLRATCMYLLSIVVLLTCATLVLYQQEYYIGGTRRPFYVYEFPNRNVPYPTLFLANKKRACIPDGSLTVQSGGRLGNLIMEYASTWSMAKLYGLPAFVPEEIIYRLQDVFQPLSVPATRGFLKRDTACREGGGTKPADVVGAKRRLDQNIVPLDSIVQTARNRHKLIVLELCVILVETIVPLANQLREEFRYRSRLEAAAQRSLRSLRDNLLGGGAENTQQEVLFVGVHVRRTDYKDQLRLLYNATEDAGVDYYKRAVAWMRQTLNEDASGRPVNIAFVVASDDPDWCNDILIPALQGPSDSLGQYGVYWGGQGDITTPEQDLTLLSACNHSIFAYGTYGLWAALMAGGRTVVYDVTGSEGNRHVQGYSPSMQFARNLDRWVAMW